MDIHRARQEMAWVHPVCYGETNGRIVINNPTGGNGAPYEFRNNNTITWQTTPLFNNLEAGIYNVKVKDVKGCLSAVKIVSLYEPAPMQFGISQQNVSCGNTANGVIASTRNALFGKRISKCAF
jgi:large repetitive protein